MFREHEGSVLTVLGMWWRMKLWTGLGSILNTLGACFLGTTAHSVVLELECAPSFTDLKQQMKVLNSKIENIMEGLERN